MRVRGITILNILLLLLLLLYYYYYIIIIIIITIIIIIFVNIFVTTLNIDQTILGHDNHHDDNIFHLKVVLFGVVKMCSQKCKRCNAELSLHLFIQFLLTPHRRKFGVAD